MGVNKTEIPIGKCILSLDLGGKNLLVTSPEKTVEKDFSMDMTQLLDEATITPAGFIYIYEFPQASPVANAKTYLETSLMILCKGISIEPYGDGFIGNGLSLIEGQKCWGVSFPLDPANEKMKRMLIVMSSFKNETFNGQLAKSVKIHDLHCP